MVKLVTICLHCSVNFINKKLLFFFFLPFAIWKLLSLILISLAFSLCLSDLHGYILIILNFS